MVVLLGGSKECWARKKGEERGGTEGKEGKVPPRLYACRSDKSYKNRGIQRDKRGWIENQPSEDERACDLAGLAGGAGGKPSFLARVSTVLAPELSCLAGGGRDTGPTSCTFVIKVLNCGQTSF